MPKKTNPITKSDLEGAFDRFWARAIVKFALREDLEAMEARLEVKFDAAFSNLDTYLKRSELWHDEQVILRASHQRLQRYSDPQRHRE